MEPKKKNKIGWVAGGCLLLLMLACVVIVLSMPKSETARVAGSGAKVGEVTGTPQTPTPIKVETYKVGDIIAVETHTIVLNSVLVNGKTIKANFTIENKGTQDMAVSSVMSFYAKDSEGAKLDLEFDCGTDLGGKVLPGDKLKGDICWTGAVNFPVKIYYESGFFTSGAVVWEVTKP